MIIDLTKRSVEDLLFLQKVLMQWCDDMWPRVQRSGLSSFICREWKRKQVRIEQIDKVLQKKLFGD